MKKSKINKWEKQFIADHGEKLYKHLNETFPELKRSPVLRACVVKMGEYFGVPTKRQLDELITPSNLSEEADDEQT